MKRVIIGTLAIAVLAYCFGFGAAPAQAWCVSVCGSVNSLVIDEGEVWVDLNGFKHVRDRVIQWEFCNGCFSGSGLGTYDMDYSMGTGNGQIRGEHRLYLIYHSDLGNDGLPGVFTGYMSGTYRSGFLNANFDGTGYGGFDQTLIKVDLKSHLDDPRLRFSGDFRSLTSGDKSSVETTTWSEVKSMYR